MKKLLAVGVIVLFLGLAIAPSINANVSKASIDNELVEITTEVYGIDGVKPHTVSLSKEDVKEVEALFDSIREQLNATETREEAEQIFNEAVVELDKYGLLGGLSVEQAQRLVTGGYLNPRVVKVLEKMSNRCQGIFNSNFLCLIAGNTSETMIIGPSTIFCTLINLFLALSNYGIYLFLKSLGLDLYKFFSFIEDLISYFFDGLPHAELGGFIRFGGCYYDPYNGFHYWPAKGWVWTRGLLGIKEWKDKFYGRLYHTLIGASGFTGIRIGMALFPLWFPTYYLGFALRVKLSKNPPW